MQSALARSIINRLIVIMSWGVTWGIAIVFLGLLVGAAAVILPPLASIGIVATAAVVLLWAMPDLHSVPEGALRKAFFATVAVAYVVPVYYALAIPGFPWISFRRLFLIVTVLLFAFILASSGSARRYISESLRAAPALSICVIGFFVMMVLSIFSSAAWSQSLATLMDATLTWYVLFATCVLIIRTREDVNILLRILIVCLVIDGVVGLAEFFSQQPLYLRLLPADMLQALYQSNPALASIGAGGLRRGFYRAVSIYNTPLAFGEFAAVLGPLCAYFVVHAKRNSDRLLGGVGFIFCMVSIFCSGARGAYMGFLLAVPLFALMWAYRQNRFNPRSMVGGIALTVAAMGTIALVSLILFWKRAHDMVLGGGETQVSDEARFIQWRLAWPHILENPVTGNGFGLAGHVVGYFTPGGTTPTVDSYIISLLVDLGVPGLIFFFGMLGIAILMGVWRYLTDENHDAELGGAIACSLIAFSVYRIGLSQVENHTLVFLLIGICFTVARWNVENKKKKKPLSPQYRWQRT